MSPRRISYADALVDMTTGEDSLKGLGTPFREPFIRNPHFGDTPNGTLLLALNPVEHHSN